MTDEIMLMIQDLYRRLNNTMRPGTISAVDHDKAKARVRLSEKLESYWLPYFARRAGNTIDWDPPEIGEQCLLLAPGGELSGGFILTGIYSSTFPQPSKEPKKVLRKYGDGLELSYDQASHTISISRLDGLKVSVKAQTMSFETDKAAIKNSSGDEVLTLISKSLRSISNSKTPTMMGPQALLPAAMDLPQLATKLESFGG